jgi:hypothetical protein
MKTSSLKLSVLLMLLITFYFSCKSKGPKELIVGTWSMTESRMSDPGDSTKVEVTFDKTPVAVYSRYVNGKLSDADSATYHLADDGQYLIVKQKSGNTDSVKIIELNDKSLKLKYESGIDTFPITLTKK